MSDFWLYFTLGLEHVLDWNAYDHILFLIALSAAYSFFQWRELLLLVTSFTVGHTLSLFFFHYNLFEVSPTYIEFLIPVTIILTALYNLKNAGREYENRKRWSIYVLTIFFGLIHGFGFARYYGMIKQDDSILPLLEFALGVEISQVVVVLAVLVLGYLLERIFHFIKRDWILVVSAIVIGLTIPILQENWPF